MAKVAVIGAGSWGTALAKVLHTNGSQVTVWSIVEAEIAMLRERHEHVDKLPGVKLPEDMEFTTDLKAAVEDKEYQKKLMKEAIIKHGKKHGAFCEGGTDHCLCGKGH